MEQKKTREQKSMEKAEKILTETLGLFCEKGIEETSVEDAAKRAGVGPATIYRYFETKAELAIQSGILYWQKVSGIYLGRLETEEYLNQSGAKQLAVIMDIFTEIFSKEFMFLKFLYEFDIFIQKYQISKERLLEYERCILNLKPYVTDALEKGKRDQTLAYSWSVDEVYFSLTHTILSLMQKLAANGDLLSSDEKVAMETQVKISCEIFLRGLKAVRVNEEEEPE